MNVVQSTLLAAVLLTSSACASHPDRHRAPGAPGTRIAAIDPAPDLDLRETSSEVEQDVAGMYDEVVVHDPWERYNRRIHGFNNAVDKYLLRPVAIGYDRMAPDVVQSGVSRFFGNLDVPVTAANQTLQGRPLHALQSLGRFVVNSTIGIGGILDPATRLGMPEYDEEDFGQTFAAWGWRDSRYLVMPLLGPGTLRDTGAGVGDRALSPISCIEDRRATTALQLIEIVDVRTRLLAMDRARREAYDEYALVRDAWAQRRRHQIERGLRDEDE